MLQEIRREGYWRCLSNQDSSHELAQYVRSLDTLDELLNDIKVLPTRFKDNYRSCVLNGNLFPSEVYAGSVVAKQPKNKNGAYWSRLLSLIRNGEARQTFLALLRFEQLDITAGEPLLLLEKRRFGMIVDSWVVYQYLGGEPSGVEQLPQVIEILRTIHEAGYQHKDPTLGNFYIGEDGRMFVIDCALRAGLGNFSRCRDLMMLAYNNDEISPDHVEPTLSDYRGTIGYRLYGLYRSYRRVRDTLKYKLRGRKPKNR